MDDFGIEREKRINRKKSTLPINLHTIPCPRHSSVYKLTERVSDFGGIFFTPFFSLGLALIGNSFNGK